MITLPSLLLSSFLFISQIHTFTLPELSGGEFLLKFGILDDSTGTAREICADPRLNIVSTYKNSPDVSIISFQLTLLKRGRNVIKIFEPQDGYRLTADQINLTRQLSSGDVLLFSDIKFRVSGGCTRSAGLLRLRIK